MANFRDSARRAILFGLGVQNVHDWQGGATSKFGSSPAKQEQCDLL